MFNDGAPNIGTSEGLISNISSYSFDVISVGYLNPFDANEYHFPIINCNGSNAGANGIILNSK